MLHVKWFPGFLFPLYFAFLCWREFFSIEFHFALITLRWGYSISVFVQLLTGILCLTSWTHFSCLEKLYLKNMILKAVIRDEHYLIESFKSVFWLVGLVVFQIWVTWFIEYKCNFISFCSRLLNSSSRILNRSFRKSAEHLSVSCVLRCM